MGSNSEDSSNSEGSDISVSEIDDHETKSYSRLKDGKLKVKYSDSIYRCPFCAGKKKQDYQYKDLLQHATGIGQSNRGSGKVKANHRALANLLKNDLSNADGLSQMVIWQEPRNPKKDDHFVWPWMGILVNAPIINKDGKFVGESGTKMKEELHQFNPLKVHALWTSKGHSGKLIVDFCKDWAGFNNAMAFEKFFEAKHFGKRDWNGRRHCGPCMYGWVARDDDYHSRCLIGDHLRKNGDLKTITEREKEVSRKTEKLMSTLTDEIEVKNQKFEELKSMYNTTSISLGKVMEDRDIMLQAHNEELREVRHRYRDFSRRIIEKNEKVMLEMERKLNDNKKKLASFEQKKADVNVLRLVEEQKREKDELLKKMRELEMQQDAKQKLELEIEHMKGQLQFMTHMEEDSGTKKKMEELKSELDDKIEDLDFLNDNYQTLMVKERMSNDELQDVRKALITGLQDVQSGRPGPSTIIGIKKMGELDDKPFQSVCKQRYPKDDADLKAAEFSSKWQEELKKPDWHPFKRRKVDGREQEVIDEEDERLSGLKDELGDAAYMSVCTALLEMNEYNPSGRYITKELWNLREKRKASPAEVVHYVFKQLKARKKR